MKIRYNHWFAPMIPFYKKKGWIYGKAMFGNLYFSASKEVLYNNKWLMRHEMKHLEQQKEDKMFWIKYIYEWIRNSFIFKGNLYLAYYNISYEIEARKAELR